MSATRGGNGTGEKHPNLKGRSTRGGKGKEQVASCCRAGERVRRGRREGSGRGGRDEAGKWEDRGRGSGRAREEAKNAWQGLSILRQMHNVQGAALHRTVSYLFSSRYLM